MIMIVILCLLSSKTFAVGLVTDSDEQLMRNSSDPNKDMYVIHAVVYQVGIITNGTANGTANATGNQETLTFYHNNGSQVDLSMIPPPLLTNVTAQSIVGVSPVVSSENDNTHNHTTWSALDNLTNIAFPPTTKQENSNDDIYKRLYKRDVVDGNNTVAVHKGSATIPSAAGIQSLAIPPLLVLNNNMSQIPVPIPNTSIVHYAKINTLITKPGIPKLVDTDPLGSD